MRTPNTPSTSSVTPSTTLRGTDGRERVSDIRDNAGSQQQLQGLPELSKKRLRSPSPEGRRTRINLGEVLQQPSHGESGSPAPGSPVKTAIKSSPKAPVRNSVIPRPPLRRHTTGPIRVVSSPQMSAAARQFADSLNGWHPDPRNPEEWNERLEDTEIVAEQFKDGTAPEMVGMVYKFDGHPVGMMQMMSDHRDKRVEVAHLVTHPGTSGIGGALLEAAVNHSEAEGFDGKLKLRPWGDESVSIYKKLGFKSVNEEDMTLDPAASDNKWRRSSEGQRWQLASHHGSPMHDGVDSMKELPAGDPEKP